MGGLQAEGRMGGGLRLVAAALFELGWPRRCEVCGSTLIGSENVMCLSCRLAIPLLPRTPHEKESLHQRLAHSIPFERVGAIYRYYRDDPYARLLHHAKYDGRPRIARFMARSLGTELLNEGFFEGVDFLTPVPLHWLKLMKRGYNQSLEIAKGFSELSGVPINDCLKVTRFHSSQTRRDAYSRWMNARKSYAVKNSSGLTEKHILLVDDVLTTGATLLACAEALQTAEPTTRISVLTLAASTLV